MCTMRIKASVVTPNTPSMNLIEGGKEGVVINLSEVCTGCV